MSTGVAMQEKDRLYSCILSIIKVNINPAEKILNCWCLHASTNTTLVLVKVIVHNLKPWYTFILGHCLSAELLDSRGIALKVIEYVV